MAKRIHVVRPKVFLSLHQSDKPGELFGEAQINHPLHFCLTLLTLGLWATVWWYLILKQQGKSDNMLAGFDDDYWSYLIEREQPPAALYPQRFSAENRGFFEA